MRREFPGIQFSVKSEGFSMGEAVNVGWTLGPTSKEVNAIADKYKQGSFDGMEDIYRDDTSAFSGAVSIVLGQSKYVSCSRGIPDEVWGLLERSLCEHQHREFQGHYTPHVFGEHDRYDVQHHVSQYLQDTSLPPGAVITGLAECPWDEANPPKHPFRITFDAPATPPPAATSGEPALSGAGYRIEKHRHTKRGFDMWLVILDERTERSDFDRLRTSCERVDGWYSRKWGRTPGGFA